MTHFYRKNGQCSHRTVLYWLLFLKNGDLFTPSKTIRIEKTPLTLSVFSAFIIEDSLVDRYYFQGKIIGYFLIEEIENAL